MHINLLKTTVFKRFRRNDLTNIKHGLVSWNIYVMAFGFETLEKQ